MTFDTSPLPLSQPVVLDLFCGAGGMSLGFQMADYVVGLGVDKDSLACRTHARNFGSECTTCSDIQSISDPKAFLKQYGVEHVDVIVGGPPCQGFSRVGRGKLRQVNNDPAYVHDPRNQLYREFVRFVVSLKPAYFVIENVPDMQYYQNGEERLIDTIKNELESRSGYLVDSRVLMAADFGVPQLRQRLFIIGNRLGKPIAWPTPTHQPDEYLSVWEAISDLPIVDIKHRNDEIPYVPRHELNEYQRQMRAGCDGVLYNHQTRWHNAADLEAFCLLQEGGRYVSLPDEFRRYDSKSHPEKRNEWFKDRYRKLIRAEPSWTVEAHIGKDTYRHIYPNRNDEPEPPRTISVREAARLQSFPDRFRFLGAFTQQFHQVGNAVPPLLAKAVAEAILPDVERGMMAMRGIALEEDLKQADLATVSAGN